MQTPVIDRADEQGAAHADAVDEPAGEDQRRRVGDGRRAREPADLRVVQVEGALEERGERPDAEAREEDDEIRAPHDAEGDEAVAREARGRGGDARGGGRCGGGFHARDSIGSGRARGGRPRTPHGTGAGRRADASSTRRPACDPAARSGRPSLSQPCFGGLCTPMRLPFAVDEEADGPDHLAHVGHRHAHLAARGHGALDHALGVALAVQIDGHAGRAGRPQVALHEVAAHLRPRVVGQERDIAVGSVHQRHLSLEYRRVELPRSVHVRDGDVRPDERVGHDDLIRRLLRG